MIRRNYALTLATSFALLVAADPSAQAQSSSDQSLNPANMQTSKELQKAQKKAEKKARREKKNAELSQLEKNGYNPTSEQNDYPQNLQRAQQKIDAQKQ